jgi:putative DNA primase/helicase
MIFADFIAQARAVRIESELARRGIKLRGKIERAGPCPVCGGHDRFSINTRKQLWNCRLCKKGGDVIALVQFLDGCEFRAACDILTAETPSAGVERPRVAEHGPVDAGADDYERRQHEKATWLWRCRRSIAGTVAETYLREARGYHRPIPSTLAFLPPSKPDHRPAMIAAFALVGEREPGVLAVPHGVGSVHLTRLRADGRDKADVRPNKLIVGSPGALPITLAPANDLLGLAITEGIEDGLTAHAATGLGVLAAGNAGRMPALSAVIPEYIECVTIYAHADDGGQDCARKLAQALVQRGLEVFIEGLR